ncbi:MAG: hypothetical protein IJM17_08720 [Firmicutes bacterium]|nr:hypothetical protein [Bacillota bacterium]
MMSVLALNCISHLLVDGVCVSSLFALAEEDSFYEAVLIYNTLAFATQCLVGLWVDRREDRAKAQAVSMLLVCCSAFLPGAMLRAAALGCGNSVFHVCGGTVTMEHSKGKARDLGLFVAPGAFGVTLGTLWPTLAPAFSALLALAAALVLVSEKKCPGSWAKPAGPVFGGALRPESAFGGVIKTGSGAQGETGPDKRILYASLLTAAVAVRAIGGSAVSFPRISGPGARLLLTFFVFSGKSLGGFLLDRLGERRAALVSVPLCAVCIVFFQDIAPLSLLGQLLLNLTMPVTLWLLYRVMPDSPGTAFGLAASALWPGTLLGGLISLTGPAKNVLILACLAFALFAVLLPSKGLEEGREGWTKTQNP